jgi:hypothetical protein
VVTILVRRQVGDRQCDRCADGRPLVMVNA